MKKNQKRLFITHINKYANNNSIKYIKKVTFLISNFFS